MWHYAERPCKGPLIFLAWLFRSHLGELKAQLRFVAALSLIRRHMRNWLRKFLGWWQQWFKPPPPPADRSRLVGMYLSGANKPLGAAGRGSDTRERQEGKFSQKRRRG
jgi:hypothetical protein